MKDLFPSYYYSLSDKEFTELWDKCTFIFDTNALLDLYEYHRETREKFFEVLESIKDRLWIPHQIALEYQENRNSRIIQAESKFVLAKNSLDLIIQDTQEKLSGLSDSKCLPPQALTEMINEIKEVYVAFENKSAFHKEELIRINEPDNIRDKLSNLFHGKIGDSFVDQAELDQIYNEGKHRYEICQPPGFGDKDKEKRKNNSYINENLVYRKAYGDLIIWKQILKQVESKVLNHIIFVTSDNKEDWWEKEDGRTIGPRRELTQEILAAGASMFYMYKPGSFLKWATERLPLLEVKEESIQEVEEVSLSNSLSELEVQDNSSRPLSIAERNAYVFEFLRRTPTRFRSLEMQTLDMIRKINKIDKKLGKNPTLEDLRNFLENTEGF
jgi:hypothetical protein